MMKGAVLQKGRMPRATQSWTKAGIERLGHDVGSHTCSQDVSESDVALLHLFPDNVLHLTKVPIAIVELRVTRERAPFACG